MTEVLSLHGPVVTIRQLLLSFTAQLKLLAFYISERKNANVLSFIPNFPCPSLCIRLKNRHSFIRLIPHHWSLRWQSLLVVRFRVRWSCWRNGIEHPERPETAACSEGCWRKAAVSTFLGRSRPVHCGFWPGNGENKDDGMFTTS